MTSSLEYIRSHVATLDHTLIKILDWSAETLGRECNSTGFCIHFYNFIFKRSLLTPQSAMKLASRFLDVCYYPFKKYKTFSVLIYSYINTSGNWKNEKLCGNTTPETRRPKGGVFSHSFEFFQFSRV